MTAFWTHDCYFELVLYFDVFTKQILSWCITRKRGWPGVYYFGLEEAIEKVEKSKEEMVCMLEQGCGEICVVHTDQGSVYTSKGYNEIIHESGLVHSLSRPGKPTDNPVNESLNGWIKEELLYDFGVYKADKYDVEDLVNKYVCWYNACRPSYALGYMTPDDFYTQFINGEVTHKKTFAYRVLDERPKFVLEKLRAAEADAQIHTIGTSSKTALI